jgi:hypothetical protein
MKSQTYGKKSYIKPSWQKQEIFERYAQICPTVGNAQCKLQGTRTPAEACTCVASNS